MNRTQRSSSPGNFRVSFYQIIQNIVKLRRLTVVQLHLHVYHASAVKALLLKNNRHKVSEGRSPVCMLQLREIQRPQHSVVPRDLYDRQNSSLMDPHFRLDTI